jgi:hypothetical protein
MNKQGRAQARANDSACKCMPANTPVVAALSAVLDTLTRHAHLHPISPSNIFYFYFYFILLFYTKNKS